MNSTLLAIKCPTCNRTTPFFRTQTAEGWTEAPLSLPCKNCTEEGKEAAEGWRCSYCGNDTNSIHSLYCGKCGRKDD